MKSAKDKMATIANLPPPPVIIIGMHRSGTSLLSQLLDGYGIFKGYTQDEHHEALFFQLINENLLRLEETTWDLPNKVRDLSMSSPAKSVLVDYAANIIDEQLLEQYWGPTHFRSLKKGLRPSPVAWGWKDPRNTIFLPVWLELFEDSKVIHIIRHGIDAAVSLWRRESDRPYVKNDPHYSPRCQNLLECFKLWEEYVEKGRTYGRCAKNYLEIRYEDLVEAPTQTLEHVFNFLEIDNPVCANATEITVKSDRRFAFQHDDPTKEFYCRAMKNELLAELYPNEF